MTAAVQLQGVGCRYGHGEREVRAVDGVDLAIEHGEFFTLLGPSGSGKTTCLRLIGGFTRPNTGRVFIGGEDMTGRAPYARPVNTVFQDYALFPHMDIRANVGYALQVRGIGRAERERRADELLALVQLPGVGARRPAELSGGQRQRVALARALISRPQVLLLDEPLGALDLKLREQMQGELKALQRRLGITFLFITHDQHEALSMSDRIGVFNAGRLEQVGTPRGVYDTPATPFVARMTALALPTAPLPGVRRRTSDLLYSRRGLLLLLLLAPPLLWFGVVYLGSLLSLLANAFFRLDDFSGRVVHELTLSNFVELVQPANLDVVRRSLGMALAVTATAVVLAFPVAYVMARHARGTHKALLYVAVMLPLWSSYLVRLYAWKLLLAREGAVSWVAERLHLAWLLDAALALPAIGGPSLSFSTLGTYIVFVYLWLPFMILPIQAAIERIPGSLIEASADLGAAPSATFMRVVLPLALPGVAAGSIFTFSLTLGDYIVPQVIGDSTLFIGQVIYRQQGVAGNLPFAAAFSLVPIAVVGLYLWAARRLGAFDAL